MEKTTIPKPKLVKTIDAKIREVQARMAAAKARYNSLSTQLAELQVEREELIGKEVMTAFRKSGRSYEELMTFLGR